MLFESKYKKNLRRYLFYIEEMINKADAQFPTSTSCKAVLKPSIDILIEKSKSEIERWNAKTDVQTLAIKNLYNISFDILSSGRLHVYRGVLDPNSSAKQLQFIVDECLHYYIVHGIASEEQAKDQKDILKENIESVG
ncbi:MAG: hypothetical protein IJL62_04920 [Clostridia bacterium]|nr:hypothetical protein [Clostridia bacterium]